MFVMATTVALILLTGTAGYLLWCLRLHFEEIHAAEQPEMSSPKKRAMRAFLTVAGLFLVGTLTVLLVQLQRLLITGFS